MCSVPRRRVTGAVAAGAVVATIALSACTGGAGGNEASDALLEQQVPARVEVASRVIEGLGRVLVDGAGHALYMFPPDAGSRVSCTGACAGVWPPLDLATGNRPRAGADVNAADLSTLHDPNTGQDVVTYAGYPLYRYSGDQTAGEARGQALFNNGGPWYVLTPTGEPVTTDPGEPS